MTSLRAQSLEREGSVGDRPVMTLLDVEKHFPIKDGVLQKVVGHVKAVDGVLTRDPPRRDVGPRW